MNHPPHFGRLLRHLRETAGVTRDEAASIVGLDGRKYHEIEMGKGGRKWPTSKEGIDAFHALMRRFGTEQFTKHLWMEGLRGRENFHYKRKELPTALQSELALWELHERHSSVQDWDNESVEAHHQAVIQEILERKPASDSIPDNE